MKITEIDVREIEYTSVMQFDVGGEYSIVIYNVFPDSIESRMWSDGKTTDSLLLTKKEFGEMLYEIEQKNSIKFIKEAGNSNRFVIKEL